MTGCRPGAIARPAATLLFAAAVASCTDTVLTPPDESPITIAGTRAATGPLSTEGRNMERGFRLAVEMLNDVGGIGGRPVRLLLRDDRSDPGLAAEIYRELAASDSVDLLIGPYASSVTGAVVPVVEAAGRPLITPLAASHTIWDGQSRRWSVQMMNNARDNLSGSVVIGAREGAETVALVYEDSRFPVSAAAGVRDAVAEQGMSLVLDEKYPIGGADHAGLAARARDLRADLFVGGGYTDDAVAFTRAAADVGYSPLLSSWSVGPAEPDFPDRVGVDLARCVIGNAPWAASLDTSGRLAGSADFVRRYEEAYGVTPGYTAAAGFGAVELLAEAAMASQSATGEIREDELRDHLFSTSTETVLGPFGVVPLGEPDAGSQRLLVRLQLQWQDDGRGGLVQRVIYPDGMADGEACSNPPPEIVVAATASLTGPLGSDGRKMANGYGLAVEMLNESGGIDGRPVRLVLRDDGSSASRAAELYFDFVSGDSVDAVLGPYSSTVTKAVVPITEAAGWPLVAALAAAPEIWEGRNRRWTVQMQNTARNFLTGSVEVAADAGLETVALAFHDSEFPRAVAEGVRAAAAHHGLDLVFDRSFPDGADYEAIAAAAGEAEADLFIGGGYSPDAIGLTKGAAAAGYSPAMMSWAVGAAVPDFPDQVGELARCVVGYTGWLSTIATAGAISDNATFVERYRTAFGEVPDFQAASGFGAVELLSEALRASIESTGGIDHATVRDHLFAVETQAVHGDFNVVPLGESSAGTQLAARGLQVQWQDDGRGGLVQRVIHPASAADAEPCLR